MKLLMVLLATIILFLTVKPGIDVLSWPSGTEQSCCAGKCESDSASNKAPYQNQTHGCNGKFCNPFQVCSAFVLLCLNIASNAMFVPSMADSHNFNYQSPFSNQYSTDFWQPPKVV